MSERTALDAATEITLAVIGKTASELFLSLNEDGSKHVGEYFLSLYRQIAAAEAQEK
jgi:hypothetical protein